MAVAGAVMWIGIILIYVLFFMVFAYPVIPSQLGGGEPRTVRVLVVKDERSGLVEAGLDIPVDKQLSAPVGLVYDGSEGYVIRVSSGSVVQVDKDAVLGLVTRP
jgi:hypothetical protein